MNERSNGKYLLAICGLLVLLSGCASTLSKVTDKPFQESQAQPTIGTSVDDLKMETLIAANIKKAHPQLDSAHVNVHSFNRVVLLTGEVPNEEMKNLAGDTARAYRGAREVYNELQVRTNTGMLARSNDSWLATKVRTRLVAEKNLNTRGIEVIVEDSVVYLMGKTTRRDANLMATIASRIGGVQRVVKVFEYLD
ncbi:MAG: BON domain-containing protein [Pseudomonadales bacterium]|nr:BON domain-containing protein [Pseudomonadales bacterium]